MRVVGSRTGDRIEVEDEEGAETVLRLRIGATVDQRFVDTLADLLAYADLDHRPPLTYREAAEALSVHPKWLQRRVNRPTARDPRPPIPHTLIGERVRFLPEHVRAIRMAKERGEI